MLRPKTSQAAPAAPEDPEGAALARLAQLAASGASPGKVVEAVGAIVAGWAGEADMDAATAQARVERLWDSITRDASELEAQMSEAGEADQAALAGARRTLAALRAAATALAAAHGRL